MTCTEWWCIKGCKAWPHVQTLLQQNLRVTDTNVTECSVNRTLELNKYLVSIIKIAIKSIIKIAIKSVKFAQYYKALASALANLCSMEIIASSIFFMKIVENNVHFVTPHAQRERGKVIGRVVSISESAVALSM